MNKLLDNLYKQLVVASNNISADLALSSHGNVGKNFAYATLISEAEKRSKKNGSSFFSEYKALVQEVKEMGELEEHLGKMEQENPSLRNINNQFKFQPRYKVGVDFKTNQPTYRFTKLNLYPELSKREFYIKKADILEKALKRNKQVKFGDLKLGKGIDVKPCNIKLGLGYSSDQDKKLPNELYKIRK